MRKHYASIIFTQSDTIAGQISKSNTFMQSAIGLFDSYIANIDLLSSISGDPIFEFLNPRCGLMTSLQRVISTVSLQNQLLPVVSGDVSGMETDPLEPALYYYHADHLGSATWITDSVGNPAQFLQYLPYGEIWRNQQRMGYDERFKYSGKERDEETGYDYFGARHYTSAFSGWLSPDPLMDKYPSISPYAYCSWNPLKYVDPDGKEKIVSLSPTLKSTTSIKNAATVFPENSKVVHVWAHGNKHGIQIYNSNTSNPETISSPEGLNAFLMNQSEIWQNREDSDPAIVVLHSCSTGKGENSIAQQFSSDELFNNVIIVAPSMDVVVQGGKEYGPANKNDLENIGEWKMFLNGEVVNSFSGESTPIFDNPRQQVERYKNNVNE